VVSGTRLIGMVQGHHPSHQYGSSKIQHYGWPYLLRTNSSTPRDYLNRHLEGIPSLPDFHKNCGFPAPIIWLPHKRGYMPQTAVNPNNLAAKLCINI
jgi:hypothetical protein